MTEKEKIVGNNKVIIRQFLAEDMEKVLVEISLNEKAQELLKHFAVLDEGEVEFGWRGQSYQRYKMKAPLRRGFPDSVCEFLFNKTLIDTGKLVLSFEDGREARNLFDRARYLQEALGQAVSLSQEKKMVLEVKLREGVRQE